MLTPKEVMENLKISRATLNRLIQRGQLRVFKIGKALRFKEEDLEEFIKRSEKKLD